MTISGSKVRRICHCGAPTRTRGRNYKGAQIWDKMCARCRRTDYRQHKKDYCEICAFVAIVPAQLDVDHIDGDRTNSDESNLQTLCANCHRLKTHTNGDHLKGRDAK
jgi:5-methylcytosine-specific restriction endonuclease McrA